MSVQVRRRREAAPFLSAYVGAQGELLVDTTNNRVQVHDGATPGGWPAAGLADLPGRNLVMNANFAINQRVYVSGTALAAGTYAHDRWKAGAGGGTYTFAQAVPDTTVTITAGTLAQAIEGANLSATSLWLSWTGTAQARVWQGSAAGAYATSPLLATGLAAGTVTIVEFATGTVGLVQVEAALPSAGPTRFERRPIAQELALCQRYYETGRVVYRGYATSGSSFGCTGQFRATKRATPTITSKNSYNAGFGSGSLATSATTDSYDFSRTASATGSAAYIDDWTASAEL